MLAHHTSGGCDLQSGDLLGSGTISGPTDAELASLLELPRMSKTQSRSRTASSGVTSRTETR